MKRHQSLQPLSRDHHFALIFAKRLERCGKADHRWLAENWAEFQNCLDAFWRGALEAHFVAEEKHLPWGRLPRSWREQLQRDHDGLASLWRRVLESREPDRLLLAQIGEELARHARWEDRDLFPAVEAAVPAEELAALEEKLASLPKADHGWLPPRAPVSP